MDYRQYKTSAQRHLSTCKKLLEEIKQKKLNPNDKKHWLNNTYYLSGYIIECMLSYALCSFLNVQGDCLKSTPFTTDSKQFKTHNLKLKYAYAKRQGCSSLNNICFLGQPHTNTTIQQYFDDWSSDYRYIQRDQIDEQSLISYIQELEKVYQIIVKQYPL